MTQSARTPLPTWYLDAPPETVAAWRLRLQWTRAVIDALVVFAALVVSVSDFPLRRLAPFVALSALVHVYLALRLQRRQNIPRPIAGIAIGIDVVLLTGLLELSGGPSNPFAVIYAVEILLAGATLGTAWAAIISTVAATAYGVLIYWHLEELVPSHHRLIDFPTHLFTMWVAIAVMAEVLIHFVLEASTAITHREQQIDNMRQRAARQERLMSLTTLAAGAAHELSTPLATVAVTSHELERALQRAAADPAWVSDAQLIRQQVDRCRVILDQMSGRAGGAAAELPERIDVAALFADLHGRLPAEQAARTRVLGADTLPPIVAPRAGLAQVLLSLVKNAFEATSDPHPVTLEGVQRGDYVRFIVRDEGPPIPDDVLRRAGEPFYTTKAPGAGFGLGLFLARMFAERCGGTLSLQSDHGTTAVLELPVSLDGPDAG